MNLRHLSLLALLGATAAYAGDATFADETSFKAAAGITAIESFESIAERSRTLAAISTPLFTIQTSGAPIGVQSGPNTPDTGYGSFAIDGSHYVSVYLPSLPQGTLRFDLATPTTSFGLFLTDIGETDGQILLRTNAGAFSSDLVVGSAPPVLADGNVRFVGITQSQAFTQVYLTVTGVDEAYGLDKVYVSAVPEPASAWLLGLGGLALAGVRARRRH